MAGINDLAGILTGIKDTLVNHGTTLGTVSTTLTEAGPRFEKAKQEILAALAAQNVQLPAAASAALDELTTLSVALKQAGESLADKSTAISTAAQQLDDVIPDAEQPAQDPQ